MKPLGDQGFFWFARHGCALMGASPEHAQVVGNLGALNYRVGVGDL